MKSSSSQFSDFQENDVQLKKFQSLLTRYLKNCWSESLVILYVSTSCPTRNEKGFGCGSMIFEMRSFSPHIENTALFQFE